jgi:hypothetical protein
VPALIRCPNLLHAFASQVAVASFVVARIDRNDERLAAVSNKRSAPKQRGPATRSLWRPFAGWAFVLVALLVGPRGAWASDCPVRTDAIATDRPDTTNSSLVVPYGSLQVENGANWAVRQGSNVFDGSETRVRLGVANCGEVLIDVPNYSAAFNGLASSELSNLVMSLKRQLFTERHSFSLSATAGLGFPVGHSGGSGHFYTHTSNFHGHSQSLRIGPSTGC